MSRCKLCSSAVKGPRSQSGKVSLGLIARPEKDQGASSPPTWSIRKAPSKNKQRSAMKILNLPTLTFSFF